MRSFGPVKAWGLATAGELDRVSNSGVDHVVMVRVTDKGRGARCVGNIAATDLRRIANPTNVRDDAFPKIAEVFEPFGRSRRESESRRRPMEAV